jgi:hypothetical protein
MREDKGDRNKVRRYDEKERLKRRAGDIIQVST